MNKRLKFNFLKFIFNLVKFKMSDSKNIKVIPTKTPKDIDFKYANGCDRIRILCYYDMNKIEYFDPKNYEYCDKQFFRCMNKENKKNI